jgi:hypothetical protein
MTRRVIAALIVCAVASIPTGLTIGSHLAGDADTPARARPWIETLPTLPIGFDPAKLTTTTTAAPRPSAARTTRPAPRHVPVGALQDMIRAGFARFGPAIAEQAVHVAGCESMGDPTGEHLDATARNGKHAGLFQLSEEYHLERVHRLGYQWEQMFDAAPNIAVAADLFGEKRKWSPTWTCAWAA